MRSKKLENKESKIKEEHTKGGVKEGKKEDRKWGKKRERKGAESGRARYSKTEGMRGKYYEEKNKEIFKEK